MNFKIDKDEFINSVLDTVYGMCVFGLMILIIYGLLWLI